jgi:hypothetical protein
MLLQRLILKLASTILLAASSFINPAAAQLVIPHGDYGSDFETYLVVAVSLAALVFAAWCYFKGK